MANKTANTNIFNDVDIRKLDTYTTPVAEAVSCFITEPSTEYDEKGAYFVRLRMDAETSEARRLKKLIDNEINKTYEMALERLESPAEKKKLKKAEPSYRMEEDEDGNETGYILFNFKRKAYRRTKDGDEKPLTLKLFDSVGRPIDPNEIEIWGGSQIAVAFRLCPFYTPMVGAGVSHRIEAIQVVKAISGGDGRTAEEYGFKKHSTINEDDTDEDTVDAPELTDSDNTGEEGDY